MTFRTDREILNIHPIYWLSSNSNQNRWKSQVEFTVGSQQDAELHIFIKEKGKKEKNNKIF